jgi:TLC domain
MYDNPSYLTMSVHHFATVFSIIFSYLTNFEEFGMLVLIMSDISDCLLSFAKSCRDLHLASDKVIDIVFGVMISTWLYTRILCLPICFFQSSTRFAAIVPAYVMGNEVVTEMFKSCRFGVYFIIFNVYVIVLLNLYWTKLMFGLLYDKLFKQGGYHSDYEGDAFAKTQLNQKIAQAKEDANNGKVKVT